MAEHEWSPHATVYDPIKVGSIDGTDDAAHDRAILRAINTRYRPNKGVEGRPECTLFLGRLNPQTTSPSLEEACEQYGPIKHVRVVRDIVTGFSKCYGFVEYLHERDANNAYHNLHGTLIDDQQVLVEYEHERKMVGWKPRRFGGGFGGKKEAGQLRFGGRARPFLKPIMAQQKGPPRDPAHRNGRDQEGRREERPWRSAEGRGPEGRSRDWEPRRERADDRDRRRGDGRNERGREDERSDTRRERRSYSSRSRRSPDSSYRRSRSRDREK